MTGQVHPKTAITYEYPSAEGDPYYPIPRPENAELYKKYERLAMATPNVWFVGRLATYRYYNMDQVTGPGAGDVPAHPGGAAGRRRTWCRSPRSSRLSEYG